MAIMSFDEEYMLDEPCLSCKYAYMEDIWNEWCCDKKECPYKSKESEDKECPYKSKDDEICEQHCKSKMTIDEAIKHCEEVAYQKDLESGFETDNEQYSMTDKERLACKECANEHRQLAEWLKDYKRLLEQEPPKSEWQHDHEILKAYSDGANEVLDKIKAEIEALPKTYPFVNHFNTYVKEDDVRKIIDKYKVESEVQE